MAPEKNPNLLINLIINVLKELQQMQRGDSVDTMYSKAFGKVSYKKIEGSKLPQNWGKHPLRD